MHRLVTVGVVRTLHACGARDGAAHSVLEELS